jgi:hypothetical protein
MPKRSVPQATRHAGPNILCNPVRSYRSVGVVALFAVITLALALACFVYAGWLGWHWLRIMAHYGDAAPSLAPTTRLLRTALLAAVLLLLLGAAIATIDRTVPPWGAHASATEGGGSRTNTTTSPTASASDRDYFASNMAKFRGSATLRSGPLRRPLCLIRYYDRARMRKRSGDPGANWWTTCQYSGTLTSVAEVRQRLALPHEWGARNGRVIAKIPAGSRVTYLAGTARRQCEPHGARCYGGGGRQILFRDADFKRAWFTLYECSEAPEPSPEHFVPCAG